MFLYFVSDSTHRSNSLSDIPVGTILPWVPEASQTAGNNVHEQSPDILPDGWVHCDGRVIPEPSPWHGSTTPNLNEEACFLSPPGNKDKQLIPQSIDTDTRNNKSNNMNSVNINSKMLRVFWIMRIW